jgi:ABC-type spermidine/putrescine transport system permease subunit II
MTIIIGIVLTILFVIPLWRIFQRAGMHPAMSLLAMLPLVGPVVVMAVLAWSDWPRLSASPRAQLQDLSDKDKLP